jgi:hypothetical protein
MSKTVEDPSVGREADSEQEPVASEAVEDIKVARAVVDTVETADRETLEEIGSAAERLKSLGAGEEDLEKAKQAGDELQEFVKREKDSLIYEVTDAAPDDLRHRVNEAASFLHSIDSPSPEALEKEFALDHTAAYTYFHLAQSFGKTGKGPESEVEHTVESEDQPQEKATEEPSAKVEQKGKGQEDGSGGIRVGSMVTVLGLGEPRKVVEVIEPELEEGSRYVVVEGSDKPIIISDVEVVPAEETTEEATTEEAEKVEAKQEEKTEEVEPKPEASGSPATETSELSPEMQALSKALESDDLEEFDRVATHLSEKFGPRYKKDLHDWLRARAAEGTLDEKWVQWLESKETAQKAEPEAEPVPEPEQKVEPEPKPEAEKAQEKKEKTKEKEKNKAPGARTIFEKLGDRAKNFLVRNVWSRPKFVLEAFAKTVAHKTVTAAEKVERLKFTGYRIGALYNSVMLRRAESGFIRSNNSLTNLAAAKEEAKSRIDSLRDHLARREEMIKRHEAEHPLVESEKVQLEVEKRRIEERIRKAEVAQKDAEARLNITQEKAGFHERRQKELVDDLSGKIDRRLDDSNRRKETLERKKAELDRAEEQFKDKIAGWSEELSEFGADLPKIIRHRLNDYMEQAQDALSVVHQERARIERDLINVDERLRPWVTMRDKFNALLKPAA